MPTFFSSYSKRTHPSDIEYDSGHPDRITKEGENENTNRLQQQHQRQHQRHDEKELEEADQEHDPDAFCTKCRCISITIIVAVALSIGLSLIVTGDPNPVKYFIPVDPPGASAANRWDATSGLTLTVESAVDEIWAPVVDQTLNAWDVSDGISLQIQRVAYDYDCSPTNGRLKVCNGDYGETPWHGINIKLVDHATNLTVHSVSKLNDRYNDNYEERLYIACHEIGHGLGLGHTDEDHFNRDRGDCMDYTIRPANNMNPGQFNLDLLVELYGTPSRPLGSSQSGNNDGLGGAFDGGESSFPDPRPSPTRPQQQQQQEKEDKEEEEEENDDRRNRRASRQLRQRYHDQQQQQQRHRHLQITELTTTTTDIDIVEAERFAEQNCHEEVCYFDVPNFGTDGATIIISTFLLPK